MANFTVTTLDDVVNDTDNLLSLREAIALADEQAGADTITFETGGTITLGGQQLALTTDVTILGDVDGDGTGDVTVSGNDASRVFDVQSGTAVMDGLAVTQGSVRGDLEARDGQGGNIYVANGATLDFSGGAITDNASATQGGGVFNAGQTTLAQTTVAGNSARFGGGIINDGSMTIQQSLIVDNTATQNIGGIYSGTGTFGGAGTIDIVNTTIAGNSASNLAGGFLNEGGVATLTNVTVTGNSAATGGGVYDYVNSGGGSLTLNNSIVLGNSANTSADVRGTLSADSANNITSGDVNAIFAAVENGAGVLADNGGSVQTVALRADTSNPALDAAGANAPTTDAAGNARFDQAGVDNGSPADLGALELTTQVAAPASVSGDTSGSGTEDDTVSGTLTVSDPNGASEESFQAQSDVAGTHGAFSVTETGAWIYTPNAAAQDLDTGDTAVDTFTVATADGTTAQVAVTLTGISDTFTGTDDANELSGYGDDNRLEGRGGNDTISGGAGTDTAVYAGDHDGFDLRVTTDGRLSVRDTDTSDGDEGVDTVMGDVEALSFGDEWTVSMRSTDGDVDGFYLVDDAGRAASYGTIDANDNRVEIGLEANRMVSFAVQDDSNTFRWASRESTFEDGSRTGSTTTYDNGSVMADVIDGTTMTRTVTHTDGSSMVVVRENGDVTTRTHTQSDGDSVAFAYSGDGRTVTLADGAGNDAYDTVTFTYNMSNERTGREIVFDNGDAVSLTFHDDGSRTRVATDGDDSHAWTTHTQVWDASGDLVSNDFV